MPRIKPNNEALQSWLFPEPDLKPADSQRRQYTLYDALTGQTDRPARYRKRAPDEVLFRRQRAPTRYEEHDIYQQHIHLSSSIRAQLPDSDLLKSIHAYASDYLAACALCTQKPRAATHRRTPKKNEVSDDDSHTAAKKQSNLKESEVFMDKAKILEKHAEVEKSSAACAAARMARRDFMNLFERDVDIQAGSIQISAQQYDVEGTNSINSGSKDEIQHIRPQDPKKRNVMRSKKRKASQSLCGRINKRAKSNEINSNAHGNQSTSNVRAEEISELSNSENDSIFMHQKEPKRQLTIPIGVLPSFPTLLSSHRSLDGSALLAMGILLEETAREVVRGRGDTVLTEGVSAGVEYGAPRRQPGGAKYNNGMAIGILGRCNVERLLRDEHVGGPRRRNSSLLPEHDSGNGNYNDYETDTGPSMFDTDAGTTDWDTAVEDLQSAWGTDWGDDGK